MSEKAKKVTKAQRFADILVMVTGEGEIPVSEDGQPRTMVNDVITFINHEIELLNKKNTSGDKKQTQTQVDNEKYKALIIDFLATRNSPEGMACTAIGQSIPELADPAKGFGTSKYSSLCTALVAEGRLVRTVGKGGKALFNIPNVTEE